MFARDSEVAYSVRGAFQPTSSKRGYRQSRRTSPAPAALDSAQELFQTVKGNTEEEACDGAQGLLRTVIEPQVDVEHAISTAPSGSQRIGLWIEMAVLERDSVTGLQRQRTRGSRWQRERGLQRQRLR